MGQEEPSCNGQLELLESKINCNPNPNHALTISHSEDEREKGNSVEEEECRVCQQQTEETLIDLGCGCRGELSKAHKSCIMKWFRTRGSNKCEICQNSAVNVTFPESQSSANYCEWRVEAGNGATNVGQVVRTRGCITPLWVAFAVLIGGLLLDVLLSILLGVSALPVNIIIGVLIVLGLGTAFRLALQCCHEWGARRPEQGMAVDITTGYHPAV